MKKCKRDIKQRSCNVNTREKVVGLHLFFIVDGFGWNQCTWSKQSNESTPCGFFDATLARLLRSKCAAYSSSIRNDVIGNLVKLCFAVEPGILVLSWSAQNIHKIERWVDESLISSLISRFKSKGIIGKFCKIIWNE